MALRQSRRTDSAHYHNTKRKILRAISQHHALGYLWSEHCGGRASLGPQPALGAAERSFCSSGGVGQKRPHLCDNYLFSSQSRSSCLATQPESWMGTLPEEACISISFSERLGSLSESVLGIQTLLKSSRKHQFYQLRLRRPAAWPCEGASEQTPRSRERSSEALA